MRSSQKPKEMHTLTGRIIALSRFVSKVMDKYITFFKVLKGKNRFQWTVECEEALQTLKKHLGQALLILKPKGCEYLLLYLAVTTKVISLVLIRKEEGR